MIGRIVFLVGALLVFTFQNCSDVKFDAQSDSPVDGALAPETPVTQVNANCDNAQEQNKMLAQSQSFTFADPSTEPHGATVCAWNEDGNIGHVEGRTTARREQSVSLQLPANAIICDMSFSFPVQQIRYDDDLIFTFNDIILATNDRAIIATGRPQTTTTADGQNTLYAYSWSSIVDSVRATGINDQNQLYCLGGENGKGSCQIPVSEQSGNFSMNFAASLIRQIGTYSPGSTHRFGVITTGDNDNGPDCQHKPITFNVTVNYVVP